MMMMDDDVHDGDDYEVAEDDGDDEHDEELACLMLTRQFGRTHLETYMFRFPVRRVGLHAVMSVACFCTCNAW